MTGGDTMEDNATEESLRAVLEAEGVPTEGGDPVFGEAWQARIFGLAVAMRGEDGAFEWTSFQERLAEEIADDAATERMRVESADTPNGIEETYYRQWLDALERLLVEDGHIDEGALRRRTAEFLEGERTAAEFVEGEHEHDGAGHSHSETDHSHGASNHTHGDHHDGQ